jgi:hypothetical protein
MHHYSADFRVMAKSSATGPVSPLTSTWYLNAWCQYRVCRSKYPCRRCPGVEPQRTASGRLEIDGCGVSSNRDKRQNAYRDNGTEKPVCTFQFASPFDHWFASGKEIHHWCSTGKVLIKFPPRCCTGQTTTTRCTRWEFGYFHQSQVK